MTPVDAFAVADPTVCDVCGKDSCEEHLPQDTRTPSTRSIPSASNTAIVVLDKNDPMEIAREFLRRTGETLHHQQGQFFAYDPMIGIYQARDEATVRAAFYTFLEDAHALDERNVPQPFKPTKPKVDNAIDALRAVCHLPSTYAAPAWIGRDGGLDPHDIVPMTNGLLHIPTRRLHPASSEFFALTGLPFAYNPEAPEPEQFLTFLQGIWLNDPESQLTLQEWTGYLLTPRTHFQKSLMLVGPKRSGKGTYGRVVRRLLGDRNVCGPTLANMGEQFGLSILIDKHAAIIADARIGGRTDAAVLVERLLSISGEDTLSIPRKFLPDWTGKLPTRFMLLTNELPKIEDASGALASRFLVLTLTRSFYGCEDHTLFDRFLPELPGILNWALDGWDRLYARGRFVQPASAAALIQEFEDLGSPIGAFLRDRCTLGPGLEVMQTALYDAWKTWSTENGREKPGTVQTFGRNLRAAIPWLGEVRPRVLGMRVRYYQGVKLREGHEE